MTIWVWCCMMLYLRTHKFRWLCYFLCYDKCINIFEEIMLSESIGDIREISRESLDIYVITYFYGSSGYSMAAIIFSELWYTRWYFKSRIIFQIFSNAGWYFQKPDDLQKISAAAIKIGYWNNNKIKYNHGLLKICF